MSRKGRREGHKRPSPSDRRPIIEDEAWDEDEEDENVNVNGEN
jgi:hypothetical protein